MLVSLVAFPVLWPAASPSASQSALALQLAPASPLHIAQSATPWILPGQPGICCPTQSPLLLPLRNFTKTGHCIVNQCCGERLRYGEPVTEGLTQFLS